MAMSGTFLRGVPGSVGSIIFIRQMIYTLYPLLNPSFPRKRVSCGWIGVFRGGDRGAYDPAPIMNLKGFFRLVWLISVDRQSDRHAADIVPPAFQHL